MTLPMDDGWSKAIKVGKLPEDDGRPVVVDMDPAADPVLFWSGKRNQRELPVKRGAPVGFTAIQVWTERMPRHDTAGAANTWITASRVVAGSGERPVGSRRAWYHGTPRRGSARQRLTSTGARYKTSRSNAAPHTR